MSEEDPTLTGVRGDRRAGSAQPRWELRGHAGPPSHTRRRRFLATGLTLLVGVVLVAYLGLAPDGEPVGAVPAPVFDLPSVEWRPPDVAATGSPATGAPSPSPSASQVAPPAAPRPAPPASPQVRPTISLDRSRVPKVVDLTSAGAVDWVHWGLGDTGSVNRKAGGSGAIVDQGGPGNRGRYDNNPERFDWRDGAPRRSVSGTPTGLYTCGVGSGFAISVAAGPRPRTALLYAGLWRAQGRLEVSLSAGGPTATAELVDRETNRNAVFTIRFQAPAGSRLLIRWTTERTFHPSCGNVNLQAVALR